MRFEHITLGVKQFEQQFDEDVDITASLDLSKAKRMLHEKNRASHIPMHSITRYANTTHRTQVIALWKAAFGYDAPHNAPGLVIDKKLAVQDDLFFVALIEGRVVGTIMAGYDGHRGWLYSVAVHPGHRYQGLGAALVRHAEKALTDRGCVKINLQIADGNESVTGFYESLGFMVEKRVSMGKLISENITPA